MTRPDCCAARGSLTAPRNCGQKERLADVERVALALFHSYDSEKATDWYDHRPRLFELARQLLDREDADADRCVRLISEGRVLL